MSAPSYIPWLHRLAVLTACVALLPILLGALVTTKDAGMAFPDWPSSDGHNMLFYPWLKENLEDAEPVEEALVEHQGAKALIAQLQGAGVDETTDAKMKVLSEYIKHHVNEEENEIFPQVRDEQEELDELGQELMARKMDLMEELGMMGDPAMRADMDMPASQRASEKSEELTASASAVPPAPRIGRQRGRLPYG